MSEPLPFTGERFVPGTRGEIWIEHWHRYHFAARWAAGRRVLDVACGEGYGSALLARHARHVTGLDISAEAIAYAHRTYAAPNVQFQRASCAELPLADGSVDVAVSFETLEHIEGQERFLDELARVLAPDGVLLLSCPNKVEYSDKRRFANEFHVKELYREELAPLVGARFPEIDWYGQRPTFFSVIAPEVPLPLGGPQPHSSLPLGGGPGRGSAAGVPGRGSVEGHLVEVTEANPAEASPRLENPLYFVLAAARRREALAAVAPALSVLADRDDWVHRDYEKVMRDLEGVVAYRDVLEKRVQERDDLIATLRQELERLRGRGWRWWRK